LKEDQQETQSTTKGIVIENLCVRYRHSPSLLEFTKGVVEFPFGRVSSLVGLSGCGKTTLLLAIAGLLRQADLESFRGRVLIFDRSPRDCQDQKDISVVFQNPALLPWLNVRENTLIPLSFGTAQSRGDAEYIEDIFDTLSLRSLLKSYPHQLSGGQKQRVNLARALVTRPKVLLLDEPLGQLDFPSRQRLLALIRRVHIEHSLTTLLITHDVVEAAQISDRIFVMNSRSAEIRQRTQISRDNDQSVLSPQVAAAEADNIIKELAAQLEGMSNAPTAQARQ
jgi:NitT/TauT family transport system ATP-binding protein